MSNLLKISYLGGLLWLMMTASCTNKADETPAPAAGLLSGRIQLWDDKITTLTDNSGATVTVDDLTNTTAQTDGTGKYNFANLPYGLHDLTITKAGYGSYRLFGISHTANPTGTTLPAVQLGKLATTSVTSLSLSGTTYNGSPGVSVLYSVSPTPATANRGYVRYFLSTDKGVSNTNYAYASSVLSVLNNNTTGGFTKEELLTAGFTSGQTVYLRIYGESVQSNAYTDPNVGITVFPNSNPNTVAAVSFVMP